MMILCPLIAVVGHSHNINFSVFKYDLMRLGLKRGFSLEWRLCLERFSKELELL